MKRINLFELYQCGGAIKFLGRMTADTKPSDIEGDLYVVDSWLKWLLDENSDHIPIRDARADGEKLRQFIAAFRGMPEGTPIGETKRCLLDAVLAHFQSILDAELSRLSVYSITRLLAYDTDVLMSNGRSVLTQSTLNWMSEGAASGFDDGARSLVLKQATGAGFLLLRAVEDVMHDYYDVLSNNAPRPARRNMGDYIAALENVPDVSPEMLEVLRSIKNLRRNPLMHPEHRLIMDDAIAIFDVSKSAITAMARQAQEHSSKSTP